MNKTATVQPSSSSKTQPTTSQAVVEDRSQEFHGLKQQLRLEISEKNRLKKALKEKEDHFQALLNSAPNGIVLIDTETLTIVDANPVAIEMLGGGSESIMGTSCCGVLCSTQSGSCPMQDLAAPLENTTCVLQNIQGKKIPVTKTVSPILSSGKKYFLINITDISKRVEREQYMLESKERFRMLFERTNDAVFQIEIESGRYLDANQAAEKLTGRSKAELLTLTTHDVTPHKSKARIRHISSLIKSYELGEVIYVRPDGSRRIAMLNTIPLNDEVVFAIAKDITERKQAEELVIQSEKMMSIGGLAAGMAHEINNPLAGIMQNLQVISNRVDKDFNKNKVVAEQCGIDMDSIHQYMEKRGIAELVASVRESSKRAAKIVGNMLSFSRKSESQYLRYDLATLLDDTIELAANDYDLKKKYDFRAFEIIREYAADMPHVPCEKIKIQQVVLNLLRNSAQAIANWDERPDQGRLTLRLAHTPHKAIIEIEDNGPGIEGIVRRRIFEPFFTTKNLGEGTGLGLSISYFIITENHGGTMTVHSVPGQGTSFIIHLPLQ